jgi:hypothetical protein
MYKNLQKIWHRYGQPDINRTVLLFVDDSSSRSNFLAIRYPGAEFDHGLHATQAELIVDLTIFANNTAYQKWSIYSPDGMLLAVK